MKANVLAAFDYKTDESVHLHMESICSAQVEMPAKMSTGVSANKISMWGTLKMKQLSPIGKGVMQGLRSDYNDDVFDKLAF